MLVHVDRDFMRELGLTESPQLIAPLEVHFSVTNACTQRCGQCYMDSGERDEGEMSAAAFRWTVDRPDFFGLACYVSERGMVPNLTTNGTLMTREASQRCRIFRQVNVSLDAEEVVHCGVAGSGPPSAGVRGLGLLREAGIRVGVNCVVTRQNFEKLDRCSASPLAGVLPTSNS
jgi:MoaA/NifB/PqqE/SkfB family radical SAM enzyme